MTYLRCWDPAQARAVLTTESRQKSRELFLRTHRPFHHIRVDFCKEGDLAGRFIGEEELRALIEAGPSGADNRLFFIVGEAGSGKSELCQWLEYRADPSRRLTIHVPRRMTGAAHVAALLRRSLGRAGAPALRRAPIETQARHIALTATVLLYERADPALAPIGAWEALLSGEPVRAMLQGHLAAAERGEVAHELPATAGEPGAGHPLNSAQITAGWPALRGLLDQALEQTLWLGDLRETLVQIGAAAAASGVRPLLLIEDITAFRALGDRLLDHLLDLSSGCFDAVIGVTTGYERTQLAGASLSGDLTHIHHRLRARLVLTDEHGRSYGMEEDVVELSRGYLRAIRPHCEECPLRAGCDESFGPGLYPFSETALRRAFAALHEEGSPRQTPRLFLEHVLGAALLAEAPPPATLDRSPYLVQPPDLFRTDEGIGPELRSLLRWYGQVGDTEVTLNRQVAEQFGVAVPERLIEGHMVRAERTFVAPAQGAPAPAQGWEQELRELQLWLERGGAYPSRETLKRGVEQVVLALGDPRSLGSPLAISLARAEIFYARGDERLPIALARGSGDQPPTRSSPKLRVAGAPGERAVLEELAYLALSGAQPAQVCQNIAVTYAWAHDRWEAYNAEVRNLLSEQLGGICAEDLVLMALQLTSGLARRSLGELPDLTSHEGQGEAYADRSPWSPQQHWGCYAAGEQLAAWHEAARRLFIGMFTLRDTLIDRTRYETAAARLDRDGALRHLAELPLPSLRGTPFRIRPTGQRLYDLLAALQRYAEALRKLDITAMLEADVADLAWRVDHLQAQRGLDQAQLRQRLQELQWRCAEVGLVWREAWVSDLSYLDSVSVDQLGALTTQIASLLESARALKGAGPSVWEYIDLRHQARPVLGHPYWRAADALTQVQGELLRMARGRYRGDSRALAGTQRYRSLLQVARTVREELQDGRAIAQRRAGGDAGGR